MGAKMCWDRPEKSSLLLVLSLWHGFRQLLLLRHELILHLILFLLKGKVIEVF
jgi:hypothetical protein